MDNIGKVMKKVIDNCDICLKGCVISKELLMRSYIQFLSKTIEKEKHNINIVLHTGSVCFDAMLLSYLAISNILYNQTNADEIVHSLNPGDMVLYRKQRYIFKGFIQDDDWNPYNIKILDDGDYVFLQQENAGVSVRKDGWNNIIPYQGKSKRLDGRGLRRGDGVRKKFFEKVLNKKDSDIPSAIDVSTILVMPKNTAFELVQGLSFRFDGLEMDFTDFVEVSYYTEREQEYPIGGNAARIEPVIKITSKVSVARKLLLQRGGNHNIGLVVLGNEMFQRGFSELPELIERKSIQYIYLCLNIDYEKGNTLLQNYDNANLFVCTTDFLLSQRLDIINENEVTSRLFEQVNAIIDHEVNDIVITEILGWEKYKQYKRSMFMIKSSDYDSDEKDNFVIQAFSLMNLFITAVFPIRDLEDCVYCGTIENVISPKKRIEQLERSYHSFPEYLHGPSKMVVDTLVGAYIEVFEDSPKRSTLIKILREHLGKRICVVVPKAYYISMIKRFVLGTSTDIVTVNRFDNTQLYDLIICVGNITGRKFDIFRCKSSANIIVLLYEAETRQYRKHRKAARDIEHFLNQRSTIVVDDEGYEDPYIEDQEEEITEIDQVDDSLYSFIGSSMARTARTNLGGNNRTTSQIVAIAKFDSDEVAFFTKNYKAYVLDQNTQTAREEKVDALAEGDTIVFTRSNSKTKDVVDVILQEMVQYHKISDELIEAYRLSKLWRLKLIDYMNKEDLTPGNVAKSMIKNGARVQEVTIRGWLDEDSHIVGPRDLSSIEQIASVIGDRGMSGEAERYFRACSDIRKLRRKILEAIGRAMLTNLTGKELKEDSVLATVQEKINDLAVVLTIENISFMKDEVPSYMINRPVSVGTE